ncbi:efflux RND transporter periplasmic adaptor subunit [Collimonas sp.]|jgi:membrane fusion protein (multidrug efflux system)|uniref:efflux RND transporter periplasmic adaptor subunit n=1 Tax=Collimonas sp. TaxID=1963772 RepID=UPI002BB31B07|nr:efflux RND transporter periplasmic adaptor subunit [Collimonas sp.]HWW04802.1 efflux RND transporter periplasmic adaptor subunit [Collimonas sp.]
MHAHKTGPYCVGLASALAVLALAGCGPKKTAVTQSAPPQVSVITARRTSVPVTMELPGRTSAYLVAQVRARVDGIVQKRSFQEGADVRAEQALYQIDPAPYRAALNSALAAQQKAEANLAATSSQAERYKILIGGNAVSKQAYDNAVAAQGQAAADVAAAKAAVASASINLGYTRVVAPISGRSSISQVTQGAYVQGNAATLLTTVQQIDPIYVDLSQSSVAGLQLRRDVASGQLTPSGAGQVKVALTLEDGSQYPLSGTLQFNGVTVDPSTGSVTVRALFPNPKYVLLPGMFVRARIEQGVNDKAILVPIPGISHNPQGQATALVVGADNKVVQRTIQTQNTFDNQWVVTGGLSDGERIIVSGVQKVQPGMLVRASETPGQTRVAMEKPTASDAAAGQQTSVPAPTIIAANRS